VAVHVANRVLEVQNRADASLGSVCVAYFVLQEGTQSDTVAHQQLAREVFGK